MKDSENIAFEQPTSYGHCEEQGDEAISEIATPLARNDT